MLFLCASIVSLLVPVLAISNNNLLSKVPDNEVQGRQNYHFPRPYISNYIPPPYRKPPPLVQESIMDALFSIAQNDDLQCVPKLVCEVASGGLLAGRQGGINVNMESLAAFLSTVNSANMSPVLHFGKAALLGFTSKGKSCRYAYPECPNDPDKLIQYLNNHNGGFFRFFQGLNQPTYFGKNPKIAENRIQNRPSDYFEHGGFKFPVEEPYRRGKKLRFEDFLDIQRPLPNHVPSPYIFPDRTGTGELKLDFNEFNGLYNSETNLLHFPRE